jgi:hypothetical protein
VRRMLIGVGGDVPASWKLKAQVGFGGYNGEARGRKDKDGGEKARMGEEKARTVAGGEFKGAWGRRGRGVRMKYARGKSCG